MRWEGGRASALLQSEPSRQESLSHTVPWHYFVWRALTCKADIPSPLSRFLGKGSFLCLEAGKPQVSALWPQAPLPPVPTQPLPTLHAHSGGANSLGVLTVWGYLHSGDAEAEGGSHSRRG